MKNHKLKKFNPIPCFTPVQIYDMEKQWFANNDSFGLMQQAAWQMAHWLKSKFCNVPQSILIAVGNGNNGGDSWALASFLNQLCPNWQINVLEIAPPTTDNAKQAKALFDGDRVDVKTFLKMQKNGLVFYFDIIIDGLFGIGLDRQPTGDFGKIIDWINGYKKRFNQCRIISIDVPSGLNATTGDVYENMAIKADFTLCLIARKVGLHLYQSKDYVGKIIDLPLIPVPQNSGIYHHHQVPNLPKRPNNTHKGSYGHVLIIGGNQLANGNGMAGASLLSASCAFAVGTGKVTVACHQDFHSAIINSLPNAMTADLHHTDSIIELIKTVDVVAIGMGLGRDKTSFDLFKTYVKTLIDHQKICVIDADGLYHLANFPKTLITKLKKSNITFYATPHSGEAGRLLQQDFSKVDNDKLSAIKDLQKKYGGNWLIKGAQTVVLESNQIHICGLGNAGMATAGMGDCLAGVVAGLLAQQKILEVLYPLLTATLIHAQAGDDLAKEMGEYALSAKDMSVKIEQVIQSMSKN